MFRAAIVILALLLAAPATSLEADAQMLKPINAVPWIIFDSDCTDDYNLDIDGAAPPAATVGGGTTNLVLPANWDTIQESYPLTMNFDAPVQVSGSSDGLCDSAPWTIIGTLTQAVSNENYYIGPLVLPPAGAMLNAHWTTVPGTGWTISWVGRLPWHSSQVHTINANSSFGAQTWPILQHMGPQLQSSNFMQSTTSALAQPPLAAPTYLAFTHSGGAGTWVRDAALWSYRDLNPTRANR
jgi:hypothetical protein